MKDLIKTIEELQVLARKHRRAALKELPTRTIFIDRMLASLGWDVHDPAEVELEYTTVDGRAVDYALKINAKPVIFLEAKALDDQLDDVKAVTQVLGYAANGGVNWCILTNGVRYKIYSSQELASAPDKLLFEISIDPDDVDGNPLAQVAASINRLSRDSIAAGSLDDLGEEGFTTAKVRNCKHGLILEECAFCNPDADDTGPDDLNADEAFEWTLHIDDNHITITWSDGTDVPWISKWTFSRVEASLMCDFADEIAKFVAAPHPAEVYRGVKTKVTEAGVTTIQTFPNFTLDTGRRIDRPYIRLERREGYWHPGIGMGRFKAKAFLRFQSEICKWAAAGN